MNMKRILLALLALASFSVSAQIVATGTISETNSTPTADCTANSCVVINMSGKGAASVQVTGTYTGALSAQVTADGVTWETLTGGDTFKRASTTSTTATIASGTTGVFQLGSLCTGAYQCRITALGAVTGSASITGSASSASLGGSATITGGDASSANQTSGAQKAQIVDGLGNVIGATSNALDVNIKSGGGSGGTSSNFGSAVPSAGTAVGASDGTNMQIPRVADVDSGGGTQYALVVSPRLSASGGAIEFTAGAGAVAAGTQRFTLASDDPAVAGIGGASDAAATQGSTGSVSAKLRTVTSQLNSIDAGIPAALGTTTDSASMPVALSTEGKAQLGSVTETAPASDTASSGLNGRLQRIAQNLTTLNTSVNATPNYSQTVGSAVPANNLQMGAQSGANSVNVAQGNLTTAINVSTATTTQLVALSGTTKIYVTGLAVVAGGTGNITFVYGTGTACGTGTTSLSGAIPLIANAGLTLGSGLGPVLIVPAGQALCVTTSAAVQMSGFVTYTQF